MNFEAVEGEAEKKGEKKLYFFKFLITAKFKLNIYPMEVAKNE